MDKFVTRCKKKVQDVEESPHSKKSVSNGTVPPVSETPTFENPAPGTSSSSPSLKEACLSLPVMKAELEVAAKKPKRRFNPDWSRTYPWILYDQVTDVILCSVCKKTFEENRFQFSTKREMTFISTGFCNWKKGTEKLKVHELSACHREAVLKCKSLAKGINVCTQMSDEKHRQMMVNRTCLLKLLSSLRYLCTQGLAIRGHTDSDSNFCNLLKIRCEDSDELQMWLQRESYTWCSHAIQNEMIDVMSHTLLRKLITEVRNSVYFAIICDETADVGRKEQFSFCLRYVTDSLEIQEQFFGFYETDSTTSTALFNIISDVLARFALPIVNCRGQCFDGAANMSGVYNGVQAKILGLEKRALYVHCLAHSLNLVVQDTISSIPKCRDALNMVKDIVGYVRDSPKRLAFFQSIKCDDTPQLRPLCPTRWTVRYKSISSILSNYTDLIEFFTLISDSDSTEAGSKAASFLRLMCSFDFFFTLTVLVKLFGRIDTANCALQNKSLHLEEAHRLITTLKASIQFLRGCFCEIWSEVTETKPADVHSPTLPRRKKIPKRYDDSQDNSAEQFDSVEQRHRCLFFEIIDSVVNRFVSRFETESYKFLLELEQFLLGSDVNKEEIMQFYKDDIDPDRLLLHREMFHNLLQNEGKSVENIEDIVHHFRQENHLTVLLSELFKFLKIVMTIPVSTATAERSFSGLKRLKTLLRSTMGQLRLNSVSLLQIHKEVAAALDLDEVADDFISRNETRKRTFLQRTFPCRDQ